MDGELLMMLKDQLDEKILKTIKVETSGYDKVMSKWSRDYIMYTDIEKNILNFAGGPKIGALEYLESKKIKGHRELTTSLHVPQEPAPTPSVLNQAEAETSGSNAIHPHYNQEAALTEQDAPETSASLFHRVTLILLSVMASLLP